MGDRAIIRVTKNYEVGDGICVYLHNHGHKALELIKGAIPRMRCGDQAYSTARLIGHCHEQIPGNLSLGCWVDTSPKIDSHGDAGVIEFDCATGQVDAYGGYMEERIEKEFDGIPLVLDTPPG